MQNIPINPIVNKLILSAFIFLAAFVFSYVLKKSVDLVFIEIKQKVSHKTILAKTRTIRSLLKNVIDVVLFAIAILTILAHWGVNIVPILTGAGIVGLAFSFGAQTLVKDLISGFFIILEDQFNIGDKIKIGDFTGEVRKITLRSTTLLDKEGNSIIIPNSQITAVIRYKGEE